MTDAPENRTGLDLAQYRNRHSKASRAKRLLWQLVWGLLCRPLPSRVWLFHRWRCFWLRAFGATVGSHCAVFSSVRIWAPWNLTLGDNCCLADGVDCYSVAPIVLGANATVSQGARLCTASHDISSPVMELTYRPITVGAGAWIAGWSIVLPGVTLGEGAVVGAGAVVTKDVPAWTVVAGNPARQIGVRRLNPQ